ncbi:MAG: response regulator transcription factor [Thermoleophilia bacterium]|nr:response regulator transcription factor [Thermoleophilia bacterium]MDH3724901.1 response regulator transcription factor [Thermoleophilia bacterium]
MRLLVVEDEPDLRSALRRGLAREGYAVDEAPDGTEAVSRASFVHYDIVVLDLNLPGLDGVEVCRRIRDREDPPLVLMLTARDAVENRIEGLDAGADDYLVKPFDFGELTARLRALIRRESPGRAEVLKVGTLTLDPATRAVAVEGESIELTAKEWSLLDYLMRNAGRVVSQEELLEHVWDDQVDPFTNTVRVQVGTLRRKVGRERIETVIGAGYRLRDPDAVPSASG